MDSLKSKRELKERRKKEQDNNVKIKAAKLKASGAGRKGDPKKNPDDDDYVTDPGEDVEGAEVDEGVP